MIPRSIFWWVFLPVFSLLGLGLALAVLLSTPAHSSLNRKAHVVARQSRIMAAAKQWAQRAYGTPSVAAEHWIMQHSSSLVSARVIQGFHQGGPAAVVSVSHEHMIPPNMVRETITQWEGSIAHKTLLATAQVQCVLTLSYQSGRVTQYHITRFTAKGVPARDIPLSS